MNKHCMSVASLKVGTTLWFDQRWRGARGGGGRARVRRGAAGCGGVRRGAHARGGGGIAREGLRAQGSRARGGNVQANFPLSFVCPMQAITYKCKQINC